MSAGGRSRGLVLALLGSLGLVGPLAARAEERPVTQLDERLARVRAVLTRRARGDARNPAELVAGLAALGPGAVPTLYGLAGGTGLDELIGAEWLPEAWLCQPEEIPGLCAAALEHAPTKAVLEEVERALDNAPTFQQRIVMLRVLGAQGSADGLALVLRGARELGDMELGRPSVQSTLRTSLGSILRHDVRSFAWFERELETLEPVLCDVLLEGVTEAREPRGMALLELLLAREDCARERVLAGMAELELAFPWQLAGRTLAPCRPWLSSADAAERGAAARLAGRLQALEVAPLLVELAADPQASVRRSARAALETMTRAPFDALGPDPELWLEREEAWREARLTSRIEALAADESGSVGPILEELARHPLYRHEIARELAQDLLHQPRAVALRVCAELERMGSRHALPGLMVALQEGTPKLRAAAWHALRTLSGEERELSVEAWRELLGA